MADRFTVYTVVKRDKRDDFWLNIGVAFPHEDGKGYNVFLQALPLDGKIVLRIADDKETKDEGRDNDRRDQRGNDRDNHRSNDLGGSDNRKR